MKTFKTKKIIFSTNSSTHFYNKILLLTIFFTFGIIIFNLDNLILWTDITNLGKGLIEKDMILANLDTIKDTTYSWPLKQVTNWGNITDYNKAKYTNWNQLPDVNKTFFPDKLLDIKEKYKYINPNEIGEHISNPLEREKVLFYKRLLTTTWTASYDFDKLWLPDTGNHGGVDILSSLQTPVYASANGVVLKMQNNCQSNKCEGFGNFLAIGTNNNEEIIAIMYGHLDSVNNLKLGDIVKKGDLIGYLGSSGNSSTPHLHFQINKLGSINQIKNMKTANQLFQGEFNSIESVKDKTYEPINFIESHYATVGDDLRKPIISSVNNNTEINNTGNDNLMTSLLTEVEKNKLTDNEDLHTSPQIKNFRIQEIKINKIDTNLSLGDIINVEIMTTTGENGLISVTTNNNVLKPSKYIISSNGAHKYEIQIGAQELGNGEIIFDDGINKKNYYFSVNDKLFEPFGMQIEGDTTIYTTIPTKYVVYPIDKLGSKINMSLQGKFIISLENKNTQEQILISEFEQNNKNGTNQFILQAPKIGQFKLQVEFTSPKYSLIAVKNIQTDIFLDYSINDQYGNSVLQLNKKQIIQGHSGMLMPNLAISRAEILTILMRYKYGDKYNEFKSKMEQYLKTKGKFFQDIKGNEWYAPYIYQAYIDQVIKGSKGKAYAENKITKAELLTIYTRFFNLPRENQVFTAWLDIKENDWYKVEADLAKKYNLYPFENLNYLFPESKPTRINAFESMYRYMIYQPTSLKPNTGSDNLEILVKKLISN